MTVNGIIYFSPDGPTSNLPCLSVQFAKTINPFCNAIQNSLLFCRTRRAANALIGSSAIVLNCFFRRSQSEGSELGRTGGASCAVVPVNPLYTGLGENGMNARTQIIQRKKELMSSNSTSMAAMMSSRVVDLSLRRSQAAWSTGGTIRSPPEPSWSARARMSARWTMLDSTA